MIISILLVGTGWTFIKNILTENERRLFVIVVPLQVREREIENREKKFIYFYF